MLARLLFAFLATIVVSGSVFETAWAQTEPDLVRNSDLTVRVEEIGRMPFVSPPQLESPVAIGNDLYLIDKKRGIYRFRPENPNNPQLIYSTDQVPNGLRSSPTVLNLAPGDNSSSLFVMFTARSEPTASIPTFRLPPALPGLCCRVNNSIILDDLYRIGPIPPEASPVSGTTRNVFQVLYRFDIQQNGLTNARPIVALETQEVSTHVGGGMVRLPNGKILFATGDALPTGTDGGSAPQDRNEHVGKLLIINPDNGNVEVAALGVRNVQHLDLTQNSTGSAYLGFADIGGVTAEEINFVRLNALLNTTSLENFGWGRHADGRAREGTFYIEPGIALVLGSQPPLDRAAPSPENGFIQPQSQYGRNDPNGGVAVSGPVTSNRSFDRITALFGDLREGTLYASTSSFDATDRPVFRVNMVNENGNPIATLKEYTGGNRSDPRFFRFPDGSAGMILERNGRIYRLTEITGNDPAPDPGLPTGDGNLIQPLADVPAGEVLFQWQRTNGATHILWRVTDSAGRVLDATRRVLSAYDCNNDNLCEWSKQLSQGDYGWDIQPFNKGTRLGDSESARFSVVGGGSNADGQPDNNNSGDDQTGNDSSGDGPLISPLGSIADNGSSPFEWTSINSADRYLWRVSDNRGNVIDATKRIPRGFGCQNDNRCTWSKPLPPGIYSWDIQAFRNNTKFGPRYAADFTIGSGDHQDNNDGDDSNDGQDGNSGNDDQGTNSPGALDLIAPINNTISTNSVTFEWSSLSAATRYLWRVLDNNGSLVDATKRVPKAYGCANGEDCQWTLSLRSGTYTWDIQAFAGNAKLGSRPSADFTVQ